MQRFIVGVVLLGACSSHPTRETDSTKTSTQASPASATVPTPRADDDAPDPSFTAEQVLLYGRVRAVAKIGVLDGGTAPPFIALDAAPRVVVSLEIHHASYRGVPLAACDLIHLGVFDAGEVLIEDVHEVTLYETAWRDGVLIDIKPSDAKVHGWFPRAIHCSTWRSVPAASAGPMPRATRVVNFPGGQATIEKAGAGDLVVVSGTDGKLRSESWCPWETGSYDTLVSLFEKLQSAIVSHDAQSVAKLVRFPFRVNGTRTEAIATSEELLKRYGKIFSEGVVAKIRKAEPRAVFCRNGSAMLGDGVIWAHRELGIALADVLNK